MKKELKKELLDGVNGLIEKAVNLKNLINEMEDSGPVTVENFRAEFENGLIQVIWKPFSTHKDVDLEYFAVGVHEEWQHNVNKYLELHNDPVIPEDGLHCIGGIRDVTRYTWKIRMRVGEQYSEVITAEAEEVDEPGNEIDSKMIWGWWDTLMPGRSLDNFPSSNTVKTYGDNVDEALETKARYVIPYIGMPDGLTVDKIKSRLQHQCRYFFDKNTDRIPFWIVQDEPKYGREYQELIIDIAKEIVPHIPATFSYSGTHMWEGRDIAQNIEHVHWNDYPFRGKGYPSGWNDVFTREQFINKHDELMSIIKSNSPAGVTFSITTQTFAEKWTEDDRWEWKWRKPPEESPLWYAEFISKYNILGGLHYLYGTDKQDVVARDMPQLLKYIEKTFNLIQNKG